jgi:sulfatase modifying factor 1
MSPWSWLLEEHGPIGSAEVYMAAAERLLADGELHLAASALDRAYGLRPDDPGIQLRRAGVLDALSVTALGLRFRYIPAGTFLMGSQDGDPDERPVHPRRLAAFWMAETPLTWSDFCRIQGWSPPPEGSPVDADTLSRDERFDLYEGNKIRYRYCRGDAEEGRSEEDLYGEKPVVVISPDRADVCAASLSDPRGRFMLPDEAQWEKAARGGLIGARYAWGDEPPTPERCDFERFEAFSIRAPRSLPPNGYGLYGMCGGVWEWTSDRYDATAYASGAPDSTARERVLRGGSWADCAEAVTVSYRMSSQIWFTPTIGMRLAADFTAR